MFGSLEGEGVEGKRVTGRRVEGNNYPQWRSQDFNLGGARLKEKRLKAKLF